MQLSLLWLPGSTEHQHFWFWPWYQFRCLLVKPYSVTYAPGHDKKIQVRAQAHPSWISHRLPPTVGEWHLLQLRWGDAKRWRHACTVVQLCPSFCDLMGCSLEVLYPVFMGFSRQEPWSRLQFPFPGDLPNSGIELAFPLFPAWQADSLLAEPSGKKLKKGH